MIDLKKNSSEAIETAFRHMRTENTSEQPQMKDELKTPSKWERPMKKVQDGVYLTLRDAVLLGRLQAEWNDPLPNAGYWSRDEMEAWKFDVPTSDVYEAILCMANNGTKNVVAVWIDGVLAAEVPVDRRSDAGLRRL